MYNTSMRYDSVFVIDALGEHEDPTGTKLVEGTLQSAAARDDLLLRRYEAQSREDFFGALDEIGSVCKEQGRAPIIHLEAHGGTEGVAVCHPPDTLPWGDLAPTLTRINIACRMNLLVVAAMCHGIHMSDILRPTHRSPAFGIIGPRATISPDDLLDALRLFYHALLNSSRSIDLTLSVTRSEGRGDFKSRFREVSLTFRSQ